MTLWQRLWSWIKTALAYEAGVASTKGTVDADTSRAKTDAGVDRTSDAGVHDGLSKWDRDK
jgi:hypothetical protein